MSPQHCASLLYQALSTPLKCWTMHCVSHAVACKGNNSTSMPHALQVAWLLTLSGQPFQPPQQYDDPNLTCTNILSELRQAGFAPATFPPTKLRQGHGQAVCGVLNALCDLAMEKTSFSFSAPTYLPETYVMTYSCVNSLAHSFKPASKPFLRVPLLQQI